MMITPEQIAEWKRLAEAARNTTWTFGGMPPKAINDYLDTAADLPALIAEVERQAKRIAELEAETILPADLEGLVERLRKRQVLGNNQGAVYLASEHDDLCMEATAALGAMQARVTEAEAVTNDVLAIIHRDGGHYQAEHGRRKAIDDAAKRWNEFWIDRDALAARLAEAERCIGQGIEAIDGRHTSMSDYSTAVRARIWAHAARDFLRNQKGGDASDISRENLESRTADAIPPHPPSGSGQAGGAAWRPNWPEVYRGIAHEPDRDGALIAVTRETLRLALSVLRAANETDYYNNFGVAEAEIRNALLPSPPAQEPRDG